MSTAQLKPVEAADRTADACERLARAPGGQVLLPDSGIDAWARA